jgi:hypothetical protein
MTEIKLVIGMRVRILCGDDRLGTITAIEQIPNPFNRSPVDVPVITLDDNSVLHGYECWWEPVPEQSTIN